MKINLDFAKAQLRNIVLKCGLNLKIKDEYGLVYENDKISLHFSTDRWEEGVTISLTDRSRSEFYYPWDLESKKGFTQFSHSYLTPDEKVHLNSLPDDDGIIYMVCVFLERYCQNELSGDFSAVMPGTKLMG